MQIQSSVEKLHDGYLPLVFRTVQMNVLFVQPLFERAVINFRALVDPKRLRFASARDLLDSSSDFSTGLGFHAFDPRILAENVYDRRQKPPSLVIPSKRLHVHQVSTPYLIDTFRIDSPPWKMHPPLLVQFFGKLIGPSTAACHDPSIVSEGVVGKCLLKTLEYVVY